MQLYATRPAQLGLKKICQRFAKDLPADMMNLESSGGPLEHAPNVVAIHYFSRFCLFSVLCVYAGNYCRRHCDFVLALSRAW